MENDIYSEWKDVVAGVPQGTKLGPEISSADGNVIFVDDTTSFEIVGKDKSSLMQSMADEASLWSNEASLWSKKFPEYMKILPLMEIQ